MNGKYHSSLYTAGWHVTTRHLSRGPQADKLVSIRQQWALQDCGRFLNQLLRYTLTDLAVSDGFLANPGGHQRIQISLQLFFFDGPKSNASVVTHFLMTNTKNNIQTFGFEWRMTPGEAAVELACLNRISVINLHNDADNYLSGATLWISAIQPKQLTLWQLVTSHQKFRG
ncbi:hypothetical protein EDD16DRAFT_1520145 [Pisolithus croceorrhizus]|nr:hypothetical protein EDD16DRAFT_1520145 [Pisolithus croceorrhizus]